eukprot:3094744-Karenia_brevis.AAC.1
MQQVKLAKFGEGEVESLRLSWDEAKAYMEDHGLTGDQGSLLIRRRRHMSLIWVLAQPLLTSAS